MPKASTETGWLSLEEAARRLNVHSATLREWADKGRIRAFRTPGGHRRFSETDVEALGHPSTPDLSLLMSATVGNARIATSGGQLAGEAWYGRFDEAAKQRQRALGMDLVRMLVAFAGDTARDWSDEIRLLGGRYAELARSSGLSLGDAMRAFHLFEGVVRSSISELDAARVLRSGLDENVGWFLNEVRVAMVEEFAKEG